MTDLDRDEVAHRINATNPNKTELLLSIGPGAPESLDEAVERVVQGADNGQNRSEKEAHTATNKGQRQGD